MLGHVMCDRASGDPRHHGMAVHHAAVGMLSHVVRDQTGPYSCRSRMIVQDSGLRWGDERCRSSQYECRGKSREH